MTNENRLLHILSLLNNNGKMSASDLANQCRVPESTIHRDIQTLTKAQIAVLSNKGRYGLRTTHSEQQLVLSTDEMLSLYIGLNSGPVQSIRCFRDAAKRVLSKIKTLMPEIVNGDYKIAKKHVAVQPQKNYSHQGAALLFELMWQATWPKQKLELDYVSPNISEKVKLMPKSLLYKKDRWYLVGLVNHRIKFFQLDFIKSVKLFK